MGVLKKLGFLILGRFGGLIGLNWSDILTHFKWVKWDKTHLTPFINGLGFDLFIVGGFWWVYGFGSKFASPTSN